MLDLETLGTRPGSVFFAIGACLFRDGQIISDFYLLIKPSDAVKRGLTMDPATVAWWMEQSEEARAQLIRAENEGVTLITGLTLFAEYLQSTGLPMRELRVWGNGASFDNALVAEAYARCGFQLPWKFWNDRCYRTVKNSRPEIEIKREGVYHNAKDDAISQAKHLMEIVPGFCNLSF